MGLPISRPLKMPLKRNGHFCDWQTVRGRSRAQRTKPKRSSIASGWCPPCLVGSPRSGRVIRTGHFCRFSNSEQSPSAPAGNRSRAAGQSRKNLARRPAASICARRRATPRLRARRCPITALSTSPLTASLRATSRAWPSRRSRSLSRRNRAISTTACLPRAKWHNSSSTRTGCCSRPATLLPAINRVPKRYRG